MDETLIQLDLGLDSVGILGLSLVFLLSEMAKLNVKSSSALSKIRRK